MLLLFFKDVFKTGKLVATRSKQLAIAVATWFILVCAPLSTFMFVNNFVIRVWCVISFGSIVYLFSSRSKCGNQ